MSTAISQAIEFAGPRLAKCPNCGSYDVARTPGGESTGASDSCTRCKATWPHKPGSVPAMQLSESTAVLFPAHESAFSEISLADLPTEINGQPVKYFRKQSLAPGSIYDGAGVKHEIPKERILRLVDNFHKLKAKGKFPNGQSSHESNGTTAYGPIIDATIDKDGVLELTHQFIGEDAILAAARNGSSVGTIQNYMDPDGVVYDEILDHNAVVPNPRQFNLKPFIQVDPSNIQLAFAASDSRPSRAVVFSSQPPLQESAMDLKPLRKALNLADTITDDAVVTAAVEKIGSEKTRADTAEQKALTLSDSVPRKIDPEILADRAMTFSDKLDLLCERGQCTPAQREAAIKFVSPDSKPNALMLSESIAKGPTGLILKLLELNDGVSFGKKSTAQPIARQTPGAGGGEDLAADGAAVAADYQKRQLAARNLG